MKTLLVLLRLGGLWLIMKACRWIVGPELFDVPLPLHEGIERRMTHDFRRRFAGGPMAGPLH
jgi:hypothetical protein